jgi:hypothetical protein
MFRRTGDGIFWSKTYNVQRAIHHFCILVSHGRAPHEFVSHICNTKTLLQFLPQLNNASMDFDGSCNYGKVTCVAFICATQNLEDVLWSLCKLPVF